MPIWCFTQVVHPALTSSAFRLLRDRAEVILQRRRAHAQAAEMLALAQCEGAHGGMVWLCSMKV